MENLTMSSLDRLPASLEMQVSWWNCISTGSSLLIRMESKQLARIWNQQNGLGIASWFACIDKWEKKHWLTARAKLWSIQTFFKAYRCVVYGLCPRCVPLCPRCQRPPYLVKSILSLMSNRRVLNRSAPALKARVSLPPQSIVQMQSPCA